MNLSNVGKDKRGTMTIGYSWLLFTFNNHCHLAAGGPVSTEGRNPVNSQFHRPKQSWNRIETTLSWYTKNLHFWSMVFKGHITLCNIITCQIHHGPLTTNIYTIIYSHETHSQAGIRQDFWHGLKLQIPSHIFELFLFPFDSIRLMSLLNYWGMEDVGSTIVKERESNRPADRGSEKDSEINPKHFKE